MYPGVILDPLECLSEDGRGTVAGEELTAHRPEEKASQSKPTQNDQQICYIFTSLDHYSGEGEGTCGCGRWVWAGPNL